MKESTACHRLY